MTLWIICVLSFDFVFFGGITLISSKASLLVPSLAQISRPEGLVYSIHGTQLQITSLSSKNHRDFCTRKKTTKESAWSFERNDHVSISMNLLRYQWSGEEAKAWWSSLPFPWKMVQVCKGKTLGNKKTPPPERFECSARRDGTFGLSTRDDQGAAALAVRGCRGAKNGFFTFRNVSRFREG